MFAIKIKLTKKRLEKDEWTNKRAFVKRYFFRPCLDSKLRHFDCGVGHY